MAAWSYFQHVFQLSVCYVVGRTSFPPVCVVNGIDQLILVHLLVQIIQLRNMN
jgi:hypothetical protein